MIDSEEAEEMAKEDKAEVGPQQPVVVAVVVQRAKRKESEEEAEEEVVEEMPNYQYLAEEVEEIYEDQELRKVCFVH